ncbi:hypothetical protein PMSD_05045 [Paenibacillus macquariensis subsp. defensor]|nr:hypothetical protein PMSD_05045 [Paenibacillus macquariensis subsp. defensor]
MDKLKIKEKLVELYFIQFGHYLIQYPEPIGYRTYIRGEIKNEKKTRSILDWQFYKHLEGKLTVGTFGGKFKTKFITFDVDFGNNPELAKWMTYTVCDTLDRLGLHNYYISFSGGKGYHVDIYFDNPIQNSNAKKLYDYVLDEADIRQYFDISNKVEFRPTDKQGIKIPLGIHQKTGNYCGFCLIETGLKVMNKEESEVYLFTIIKTSRELVLDLINSDEIEIKNAKREIPKLENAISSHKPLASYDQSEDYSIDLAKDMFLNGLKIQGSRNNSMFLVGMYLKYQGFDEEECRSELYKWMDWQDKNTYSTPIDQCYKEIDASVKNMYEKNYNLAASNRDLTVRYDEMKWIIEKCPEKNQKLIAYAMLIHSKRYADAKGIFHMKFDFITEATGLYDQAVQAQINKLEKIGVIVIAERNRIPKGKGLKKKLPNLYRMNIETSVEVDSDQIEKVFTTNKLNSLDLCMTYYFTDTELKKLLPRRQYEGLIA